MGERRGRAKWRPAKERLRREKNPSRLRVNIRNGSRKKEVCLLIYYIIDTSFE